MNTEKIYDLDPRLTTFEATVITCIKENDYYHIVLDRTAFFPEEGGQYADIGTIQNIPVLNVQIKNNLISHTMEYAIEPNSKIEGIVDWDNRFDNMQQHSGEHIISGLIHQHFNLNNVGFHLGRDEVTLDFNGTLTKDQIDFIEIAANKAIYENFDVNTDFPTKEILSTLEYRSKIALDGSIRIVTFPHYDTCACCAPHVSKTGEIGLIKITNVQNYKGGIRINILCGSRALNDYGMKTDCISALSSKLSAKPSAIIDAVARLETEIITNKERLISLQQQLLQAKISAFPTDMDHVCLFEFDLDSVAVRKAINHLVSLYCGYSCIFIGDDVAGYRYIIGSSQKDCQIPAKLLRETFSAKGGGSSAMVQGQLLATQKEILQCLNLS